MPSIAPLTADQIADLYGAIDEFVGTGDGIATAYQLDFFPVVGPRTLVDDLIGLGDGVDASYQINFFPVTSGSLTLRKGSITGSLLTDPTHYSAVLSTGVVTLTGTGVTFLALEPLRAAYTTPPTLELHKTSISGPLLIEGTDYTVNYQLGAVTLTAAGVTFLGVDQLHADYQIVTGLVNVLTEANGSLGAANAQAEIQKVLTDAKDSGLKFIHESIQAKAILDPEAERKNLVIPGPTVASPVTETGPFSIFTSIDIYAAPLYPVPPVGDPSIPAMNTNLFGGSGIFIGNEQGQIAIEQGLYAAIIDGHPDTIAGWAARFAEPSTTLMLAAIALQQTALTAQIAAIASFLALNPVPNDHVTAGDLADATAASAAASARFAVNVAYVPLVTVVPHSGLSDAQIAPGGLRDVASTARATFITGTRGPQLFTLLTFLWGRRFFWITQRARLADGTLASSIGITKGIASTDAQIANNTLRIAEILTVLGAQ